MKFSLTDKIGFALGTVGFLLTMPVTIFVSALPGVILGGIAGEAVTLACLAAGAVLGFVVSTVVGLAASYGGAWLWGLLLPGKPGVMADAGNPGKWWVAGLVLAGIWLACYASAPVATVVALVEHLFPAPLLMSLGTVSVNLSHWYAVVSGWLAVGSLGLIIGTAVANLFGFALRQLGIRA